MSLTKKIVLFASFALFATWGLANLGRISADDEWVVRFILGTLFAVIIVFRPKREGGLQLGFSRYPTAPLIAAVLGVALSLAGMIFNVNQFEWLGLIIILYSCLSWSLPDSYGLDVMIAVFILYWVHPLPGQIFGRLELAMQWVSVQGAESLLHTLNERVWADNMILYTGLRVFGVPEACSGMRTAVTVLLCVLGTGILMRVRWYNVVTFLILGLVQVMLLNIVRVSFMVMWADNMPTGWGETFLHDSLGIFLLISIVLVQFEVVCWRRFISARRKKAAGIESGEIEEDDRASILPVFWQFVVSHGKYVLMAAVLILGVAFFVFKQRPYHRAMMYYDVVESLMESDAVAAEKAIDQALVLLPGDRDLQERRINVLIQRNKPEMVLQEIAKLGDSAGVYMTAMKSWALMCVGRLNEAVALVNALPDEMHVHPRVAMIKAEQAAAQGKVKAVKANVLLASQDVFVIRRVRQLFLFLAAHGMWETIVQVDKPNAPYREFPAALASIQAGIKIDDTAHAGKVMRTALKQWPDEVRLLSNLFELAKRMKECGWEDMFADRLLKSIDKLDVDRLAAYIDYSLKLKRPDLAWLAYARLRDMDPQDPMIYLAPAMNANDWFAFRRHHIGLGGARDDLINMKSFTAMTKDVMPFNSLWKHVPLSGELSAGSTAGFRDKYMKAAVAELKKREAAGTLTRRMHQSYPMVLAMSGDFERAHIVQSQVGDRYPDMRRKSYLTRANFYSWQRKWEEAYEILRKYYEPDQYYELEAEIILANVLMNLDMGAAAMVVAERASEDYPESVEARQMIGLIWNAQGFKEDALHILSAVEKDTDSRVMVSLLNDTGRYSTAERTGRAAGLDMARKSDLKDRYALVPVEAVLAPKLPGPLTDAEMDGEAVKIEAKLAGIKSPFIREYNKLLHSWYRKRGQGEVSSVVLWDGIGRDAVEKAFVLSRLAVLSARQKDKNRAVKAISKALEYQPQSVVLHRLAVLLSGSEAAVNAAREACPEDSDIWLASLAARCIANKGNDAFVVQLESEMNEIVGTGQYSIGAVVRAADYLLRKKYVRPAEVLTRYAVKNAAGYLPAYVVGIRCALDVRDTKWALKCALEGADNAIDAAPFYRMIVTIKSQTGQTDADLVRVLQHLQEQFPNDNRWTEGLGYALFDTGDTAQAKRVLSRLLLSKRMAKATVGALMLAAEASRMERDTDEAIRILKELYRLHPNNARVLNNLVYTLSQDPRTLDQARTLLPGLLKIADNDFIVYDTAAMVYLRCGQVDLAGENMDKAMKLLDKSSPSALEVRLNHAEILFARGALEKAAKAVQEIRKAEGIPSLLNSRALDLAARIRRQEAGDRRQ